MTVIPTSETLASGSDRGAEASADQVPASTGTFSLLAIDDNPSDLEILRRLIRKIPEWTVEITTCTEAMEGLALLEQRPVDVVLVDYRLGAINGIQLLEVIRRTGFQGSIVVLTGQGDERLAAEAMRAGAADYVPKADLSVANLRKTIDHALERGRLQLALTEHRKRLECANQDLQQKNHEIRSFYHTLSHELKTPLTAAREFVSILLDGLAGELSPTQVEYLRYVKEGCDQMTTCLNDILDVTRMETGRLSIAPSAQAVPALVQRVAAGFVNRAKAAGVEIEQRIAADLPDAAIDPHRIAQVISNLVDNSLKFTASGGKVVVDVAQSPAMPNAIRVSVSDTGKGIAPEHLANVFERLYQVRDGTEQSRMGLGLGLFVCREIVRLHGGELSVTSEVGKGTTFTFDLPVASVQPTPPSEGIQSHG
jgi:signal transduction histidine kinase